MKSKISFAAGMMKVIIPSFISFTLLSITDVKAQPAIQWQNTIGGNSYDELNCIRQTTDGGYILAGISGSTVSGDKTDVRNGISDFWIVKTNSSGVIQWQNSIGGAGNNQATTIELTSDGGYIVGGFSDSNISGDKTENNRDFTLATWDFWMVKLNASGNIQWEKTIGGSDDDVILALQQTTDGGYIVGGYSASDISGDKTENSNGIYDYWLVKTDASGNIQWQNTIGGDNWDWLSSLQQTTDGGYILGGFSSSGISGDKTEASIGVPGNNDYWLIKTDASGNIQWQNTIGGNGSDVPQSVRQTADGGYIIAGSSDSGISGDKTENSMGATDYWLVKTNGSGNIQWQNTIGGNDRDELTDMALTADGGYILGGRSWSNASGDKTENMVGTAWEDYWVVKTNASGNIQWQNNIGGTYYDHLSSVQQTADGGYILGGYSISNISGDKSENSMGSSDYWILKLAPCNTMATITAAGTTTFCNGGSVVLNANTGTGLTYQWKKNGTNISPQGTGASYTANTAGSYTVVVTNACGSATSTPVVVIVNTVPPAPGAISGASTFCAYQTGVVYSIAPVAGALSYSWQVPIGATITSGQGTASITVSFGNKNGKIKVASVNSCGTGAYTSKNVTKNCREGVFYNENEKEFYVTVYPNPVSNSATISFSVEQPQKISIRIFDMAGRLVSTLTEEIFEAGENEFTWNASDLTTGVYFLRIEAESYSETKKVSIIK